MRRAPDRRRTVAAIALARWLAGPATFPILTDIRMGVIRAFGMKGEKMEMADMGYVIIDKQGRVRTRQIDRFGENVDLIARALREARRQA